MSKREHSRMHPLRVLTLLGGALGCYAGLSAWIIGQPVAGATALAASCAVITAGEVWNHRKRHATGSFEPSVRTRGSGRK